MFVVVLGVTLGGFQSLQRAKADIRAGIYRDKLLAMSQDLAALRDQYNAAVAQTAVTELVVEGGEISVRVRDGVGVDREIPTPFDPSREIYVDYAVLDGRLWIRRVFDDRTPPLDGVVIDPELAEVDWDGEGAQVGKAVYRSLGEGVWQISVTGQGALGLVRVDEDERPPLQEAPEVASFETIEAEAREEQARITFGDLWRHLFGGNGQ
ncbi:MAG: hypothetical protein AAFX79_09015 [Planctomycetota bacterium]